jgi:hypothetical protein
MMIAYAVFVAKKKLKERDPLGDTDEWDDNIKIRLKIQDVMMWIASNRLSIRSGGGIVSTYQTL